MSSQHDPTLISVFSHPRCIEEFNVDPYQQLIRQEGANLTLSKPNTNQQSGKSCRLKWSDDGITRHYRLRNSRYPKH